MLHTTRSNEGIALIAMIETPEGVENAQAIACVEGVDAVFVGSNDLAHAMGYDNNWTAPPVEATIEKALRAIASTGKCAGTVALTPEAEDKYAAWGARYLANVATSIITQALRQAASRGQDGISIQY